MRVECNQCESMVEERAKVGSDRLRVRDEKARYKMERTSPAFIHGLFPIILVPAPVASHAQMAFNIASKSRCCHICSPRMADAA